MSSILVTTVGTRGDVQPFLALSNALASNGHTVTFSTGVGFEKLLEGAKLKTAPLSIDIQDLLSKPVTQSAMHSLSGKWQAYKATKHLTRQLHKEIWDITTKLRPDVIVYSPKAFIANHAARSIGAVAIPAFLQPAFSATKAFPNPLLHLPFNNFMLNRLSWSIFLPLMQLAYRLSLHDVKKANPQIEIADGVDVTSGYAPKYRNVPRLYAHSQHILPKPEDWTENEYVTGPWYANLSNGWTPPSALKKFLKDGQKPIYIGFGSMPSIDPEKLSNLVLEALEKTNTRAILAKGWGALQNISNNKLVHVIEDAPHDWLFGQVSAVVHHGGAGTTHEGLRCGRPSLICPVFGDQPFWADTIHRLGAGPTPIYHNRLTVDNFSKALEALKQPQYAQIAGSIGTAMRKENGTKAAVALIEQFTEISR